MRTSVEDLNDPAVERWLRLITEAMNNSGPEDKRHFLDLLVEELDMLDQDDCFGTEGWRHTFGVED